MRLKRHIHSLSGKGRLGAALSPLSVSCVIELHLTRPVMTDWEHLFSGPGGTQVLILVLILQRRYDPYWETFIRLLFLVSYPGFHAPSL